MIVDASATFAAVVLARSTASARSTTTLVPGLTWSDQHGAGSGLDATAERAEFLERYRLVDNDGVEAVGGARRLSEAMRRDCRPLGQGHRSTCRLSRRPGCQQCDDFPNAVQRRQIPIIHLDTCAVLDREAQLGHVEGVQTQLLEGSVGLKRVGRHL